MIRVHLIRAPVVNREEYLVEIARDRMVLHLGCADATCPAGRFSAYYTWWPANGMKRLIDKLIGHALRRLAPWLSEGLIVVATPN